MKHSTHKISTPILIAALVCVLGGAVGLWVKHRWDTAGSAPPAPTGAAAAKETAQQRLENTARTLAKQPSRQDAQRLIRDLTAALAKMRPEAASAMIHEFLDGGADASTQAEFGVGANGFLTGAPTLRVWLLDQLGRVDPAGAAAYARKVLAEMNSPDEWAVCLRSLALGDTSADGRRLLVEKAGQLLRHEPWQQNPSVGYLESFDVAVHLEGTNLLPTLSGLVSRKDNQAVAHAAHLALDRLAIQDAAATLGFLQSSPDLMAGRELARADLFARTDVRDPRQRQVVENYLLNSQLTAAEANQFAGVYPNANFRISQNLLTRPQTPGFADLSARDAASLGVVNEWLADARFAPIKPQLEKIKDRLQTFVKQAGQSR